MVRWSKKEKQDKRVLLSSLNQMDTSSSNHEADNGKYDIPFTWNFLSFNVCLLSYLIWFD